MSSTSAPFVPGFEPLVITEAEERSSRSTTTTGDEDEDESTECETEEEEGDESSAGNEDENEESDTSSTERCAVVKTKVSTRPLSGAGSPKGASEVKTKEQKPHALQKMSSFDFKRQQAELELESSNSNKVKSIQFGIFSMWSFVA
jgi:hypothetical protein